MLALTRSGDLGEVRRVSDGLSGVLDGDLVLAGQCRHVGDCTRPVLVVLALDLSLRWTLDRQPETTSTHTHTHTRTRVISGHLRRVNS